MPHLYSQVGLGGVIVTVEVQRDAEVVDGFVVGAVVGAVVGPVDRAVVEHDEEDVVL